MSIGQVHTIDEGTNFQRARLSELKQFCREKNLPFAGDVTKNELLKIIDVRPLIKFDVPDIARKGDNPDLGSHTETNDEKRTRLKAQLAELEKPQIFSTKILNPQRTPEEDMFVKLDQMQHHERKKWLVEECQKKGVECRFPGIRGKGPEVLAECKRVASM